ncbi:unnamed protein product [Adineta steineri]|uniref:Uncharacterized protein n=1 Tax=Adineta steineri TaxID=433720 RepID=A0A813NAG7_9BILA|nr:unnamed protein product [Adineta steineri]CAF1090445.1 unnamed protein product [Adineta steineri]CAF1100382.1 unnamed protein product [Adineta steineri]
MIASELDTLIEDHNNLQDKINQKIQCNNSNNSLFIQIDEWQRTTIEKVKQVAEQARQQVIKLLDSQTLEIKAEFDKLSEELTRLKATKNLVEEKLKQLKQTVCQLDQNIQRVSYASDIELHMEKTKEIPWHTLIYAEQKLNDIKKQEFQPQVKEQKQTPASSYQLKRTCNGHACTICDNCCDWNYNKDYYAMRSSATCNRDYVSELFLDDAPNSIYDDTLYSDNDDSLYHGRNAICHCEDNI